MGKVIPLSQAATEQTRLYNQGFRTAYSGEYPDLSLYENSSPYRRGYDAGEEILDDMRANPGDYDDLSEQERVAVYGREDEQV